MPQTTTLQPVNPPAQGGFAVNNPGMLSNFMQQANTPQPQSPTPQSPPAQQMSPDDFANSIKAKYPQYQNIDNQTLTQKMLAKYPQYQSVVKQDTPQPFSLGGAIQGTANTISNFVGGGPLTDFLGSKIAEATASPQTRPYISDQTTLLQALGSAGQVGLTAASLLAGPETLAEKAGITGLGETALGRVGANVGLGAAFGATGALAQGQTDPAAIAQNTALGAGLGGALGTAGEGLNALFNKLPARIVQKAIGVNPENAQYAMENVPLGSTKTMLSESQKAIQSHGGQIDSILQHPDYVSNMGNGDAAFETALQQFPNSNYTRQDIVSTAKDLAPEVSKLIDKIDSGEATLYDKNVVRKAIDNATKSVYTSVNRPPEKKAIGAAFAGALRQEVQETAPETQPIFQKLQQEINLRGALTKLNKREDTKKAVGLYDLIAGGIGGGIAGLPGIAAGVAGEKILRSPAVNIGAARALTTLGKSQGLQNTGRISKTLLLQKLLSSTPNQ